MKVRVARKWNKSNLIVLAPILTFLSQMKWKDDSVTVVVLVLTLFLLVVTMLSEHLMSKRRLLLILLNVASVTITILTHSGLGIATIYLNLLLFCMLFNSRKFSKELVNRVHLVTVICILLFLISGEIISYIYDWLTFANANGDIINNNSLALVILALFFHGLFYITGEWKGKKRAFGSICIFGFCMFGILICKCRSALLAMLLFVGLNLMLKEEIALNKYRKIIRLLFWGGFLIPIAYVFLFGIVDNFQFFGKNFFSGRQNVWKQALEQAIRSPIFGVGTDYYIEMGVVNGKMEFTESAHNMVLGLWRNLGIIPVLSLMYNMIEKRTGINNKRSQIALISVLFICFFETLLTEAHLFVYYVTLLMSYDERKEGKNLYDT